MKQLEGAIGTGQEADAHRAGEAIVTPLRKRRLSGELYERDPKIEALIAELAILPRDELIARAAITKRYDPRYIPSECLVYFIRASRHDNDEAWFERLYRILIERVLRSLPRGGKLRRQDGVADARGRTRQGVRPVCRAAFGGSRRLCRQGRLFRGALRWRAGEPAARRAGAGLARREPFPAPRI